MFQQRIVWRVLCISLLVITLLMLPICALLTFVLAFGAENNTLYRVGYYFYYVEFFAFPVLSIIFYRYAAHSYKLDNLRKSFVLITVPLVVFLLSMLFFSYFIVNDKIKMHHEWHAISTPHDTSYICSNTPKIFIDIGEYKGSKRYTVTRVDQGQSVQSSFYYSYANLKKYSNIDLSKCENHLGKKLASGD